MKFKSSYQAECYHSAFFLSARYIKINTQAVSDTRYHVAVVWI